MMINRSFSHFGKNACQRPIMKLGRLQSSIQVATAFLEVRMVLGSLRSIITGPCDMSSLSTIKKLQGHLILDSMAHNPDIISKENIGS